MRALRAIAYVAMTLAVGCGASSSGHGGSGAPEPSPIARIHKAKCGACHVRVEPGERTRAQLEDAFTRHHTRVRLTDEQWTQMVDYLAARDDVGAAPSP